MTPVNFRVRRFACQFIDGRSWTFADALARAAHLAQRDGGHWEVCELRAHPRGVAVRLVVEVAAPPPDQWEFP